MSNDWPTSAVRDACDDVLVDRVKREQERQANLNRYDPEREQGRLALLEHRCVLAHKTSEVARLRSGEAFPATDPKRRAEQVAELDEAIVRWRWRPVTLSNPSRRTGPGCSRRPQCDDRNHHPRRPSTFDRVLEIR